MGLLLRSRRGHGGHHRDAWLGQTHRGILAEALEPSSPSFLFPSPPLSHPSICPLPFLSSALPPLPKTLLNALSRPLPQLPGTSSLSGACSALLPAGGGGVGGWCVLVRQTGALEGDRISSSRAEPARAGPHGHRPRGGPESWVPGPCRL